jgi:hypothetical protein
VAMPPRTFSSSIRPYNGERALQIWYNNSILFF